MNVKTANILNNATINSLVDLKSTISGGEKKQCKNCMKYTASVAFCVATDFSPSDPNATS